MRKSKRKSKRNTKAIIPTLRCRKMRKSLEFYTMVLDFQLPDGDESPDDVQWFE